MTRQPNRFHAIRAVDSVWRVCWFDALGNAFLIRDGLGHNRARALARTLNDALEAQ